MQIFWILFVFGVLAARSTGMPNAGGADGSKCPNVSCSPPLPGAQCTPKYERDDGCCPVWYCTHNGATSTIYGKSSGGATATSSSSFQSSGFGNPGLPGGLPGFKLELPNLANLFG